MSDFGVYSSASWLLLTLIHGLQTPNPAFPLNLSGATFISEFTVDFNFPLLLFKMPCILTDVLRTSGFRDRTLSPFRSFCLCTLQFLIQQTAMIPGHPCPLGADAAPAVLKRGDFLQGRLGSVESQRLNS